MVKTKSKGYKIGMVNKQGMLFKDLCEMYFKRCEANGVKQMVCHIIPPTDTRIS